VSIEKSCKAIELTRSMWYYQSKKDDSEVIAKLSELAEALPTRGFDEYFGRIRQQGYKWNRKRVLRIYRLMRLSLRRKHKKRLPARIKHPLTTPDKFLDTWSMDFMSDALTDGRRIRILNIIDDYNREALAVEAGIGFPSNKVIRVLEHLGEEVGLPKRIRVDNGPEFTSNVFQSWCGKHHIEIRFIQPGSPTQNAFIERFNRYFREDVLDAYWFEDLEQLRIIMDKWRVDYNENHPHKSLGRLSPNQYKLVNDDHIKHEKLNLALS
jgi:putative transposase